MRAQMVIVDDDGNVHDLQPAEVRPLESGHCINQRPSVARAIV